MCIRDSCWGVVRMDLLECGDMGNGHADGVGCGGKGVFVRAEGGVEHGWCTRACDARSDYADNG